MLKKNLIPTISALILIAYGALLIKVMVFKDIPMIKIGSLMLNLGGTNAEGNANFVPFKTILSYIFSDSGLIGVLNIVGNIALLVPVGLLVPLVYGKMNWKKSLIVAVAAGLIIEGLQVILRVGIFDIDDVILNGLGVMIGYFVFVILAKLMRSKVT